MRRLCNLAVLVVVLLELGCHTAQGQDKTVTVTPTASSVPARAEELLQDIQILRLLDTIKLTAAQAAKIEPVLQGLKTQRQALRAQRDTPEVLQLLQRVRAELLAGKAPEDQVWRQLQDKMAGFEQSEGAFQQALDKAAQQICSVLNEDQQRLLIQAEWQGFAREVFEQLGHIRAEPAAEWAQWLKQVSRHLARAAQGEQAGDTTQAEQDLQAFFGRVRKMPTDEYWKDREGLRQEFLTLLGTLAGPLSEQARRERWRQHLNQWLENPRWLAVLHDKAQLAGAQ